MKIAIPLYLKILLWFFLNLILLGVIFLIVIKAQFRFGFDTLLTEFSSDQIQRVADILGRELTDRDESEWADSLKRFSKSYQVEFLLYHPGGEQVAGTPTKLPAEVLARLRPRGVGPPGRPFAGPPNGDRPFGPGGERPFAPPGQDAGPPNGGPPGAGPPTPRIPPKTLVHTREPDRYWMVTPLPLNGMRGPRPGMLLLVTMSPSLRAGGLFFDFLPWLYGAAAVVLISVLFWFPLVRGITRSISQMTQTTEQIAQGHFEVEVRAKRRDELGRLGDAINRMAARLAGFVTGQKRFLGDVAHELCSPLARIQVALGILDRGADAKQSEYLQDVREEVEFMSGLVHELLSFSKASWQGRETKLQSVNLAATARAVAAREAKDNSQVVLQIDETLEVAADPDLLSRALANLVRNALHYAGHALVSAEARGREVVLRVIDNGPGVPAETLERIFDPFFRVDPSRSRDSGGAGLGLAIVKTCVEACRGTVSARNLEPAGFEVEIVLESGAELSPGAD